MTRLAETQPTLAAAVWPLTDGALSRALRYALLMLGGTIFVALCAQARVPLYPVPITGQTFAVLIVGMAYGWRLGGATLLLYMGAGAVGIPVFANWSAGPGVIAGATGGYIIGFVLAAAVLGYLAAHGWTRNLLLTALAMVIGNILIYLPGVPWLAVWYATVGAQYIPEGQSAIGAAFSGGMIPFLIGDALKLALAACLMPLAWMLVGKLRR